MESRVQKLRALCESHIRLTFTLILIGTLCVAWHQRFILDYAYIVLRYADNLVNGEGLVWNAGERVEGYTNLFWTLLLAIPLMLGTDPIAFIYGSGMVLFALSLSFTYKLGALVIGSRPLALLLIFLLGINPTFAAFATGGLGTQLQTVLAAACAYFLLAARAEKWTFTALIRLSLSLTALTITRLDASLFVAPLALIGVSLLWREPVTRSVRLKKSAVLILPPVLIMSAWLGWKFWYYGDILPNTFYVKTAGVSWIRGAYYVAAFFITYWLFVLLPWLVTATRAWFRDGAKAPRLELLIPGVLLLLWFVYVVWVGGDFMEFRFLVPALPFLFVLTVWFIRHSVRRPTVAVLVTLAIVAGAIAPLQAGSTITISSRKALATAAAKWCKIGRTLAATFDETSGVTLAVTAAGAIPYYSRLRAVDELGLNDRWVAAEGVHLPPIPGFGNWPGHTRIAPIENLVEREVNLVIQHPWLAEQIEFERREYQWTELVIQWPAYPPVFARPNAPKPSARLLEIPITPDRWLRVIYLTQHPAVERAIVRHGWRTFPIREG